MMEGLEPMYRVLTGDPLALVHMVLAVLLSCYDRMQSFAQCPSITMPDKSLRVKSLIGREELLRSAQRY